MNKQAQTADVDSFVKTLAPADTDGRTDTVEKLRHTATVDRDSRESVGNPRVWNARIRASDISVHYGDSKAIRDVNLDLAQNEILAMIGPSGCGKSTLLRCFNRMNDTIDGCRVSGDIMLDGENINAADIDVVPLRARVGMVFQKPNPFPKSVWENVAFGPKIHRLASKKADLEVIVESSLRRAALWDEVKDRLDQPGTGLSGGQQQRLCIARAIAVQPDVLLMDEPCSALDPISTAKIEELMLELRSSLSIAIVTHSMQQAARVSDRTAYFHMGDMIEVGETKQVFSAPQHQLTEDYVSGVFG